MEVGCRLLVDRPNAQHVGIGCSGRRRSENDAAAQAVVMVFAAERPAPKVSIDLARYAALKGRCSTGMTNRGNDQPRE